MLKKCPKCQTYTLKTTCPKCNSPTKDAHYKFLRLRSVNKKNKSIKKDYI